jgi:hypothetical protein
MTSTIQAALEAWFKACDELVTIAKTKGYIEEPAERERNAKRELYYAMKAEAEKPKEKGLKVQEMFNQSGGAV